MLGQVLILGWITPKLSLVIVELFKSLVGMWNRGTTFSLHYSIVPKLSDYSKIKHNNIKEREWASPAGSDY
jgi:hypothetical protein